MPRQPGLDTPGALNHVVGRGIDCVEICDLEILSDQICHGEGVEKKELWELGGNM